MENEISWKSYLPVIAWSLIYFFMIFFATTGIAGISFFTVIDFGFNTLHLETMAFAIKVLASVIASITFIGYVVIFSPSAYFEIRKKFNNLKKNGDDKSEPQQNAKSAPLTRIQKFKKLALTFLAFVGIAAIAAGCYIGLMTFAGTFNITDSGLQIFFQIWGGLSSLGVFISFLVFLQNDIDKNIERYVLKKQVYSESLKRINAKIDIRIKTHLNKPTWRGRLARFIYLSFDQVNDVDKLFNLDLAKYEDQIFHAFLKRHQIENYRILLAHGRMIREKSFAEKIRTELGFPTDYQHHDCHLKLNLIFQADYKRKMDSAKSWLEKFKVWRNRRNISQELREYEIFFQSQLNHSGLLNHLLKDLNLESELQPLSEDDRTELANRIIRYHAISREPFYDKIVYALKFMSKKPVGIMASLGFAAFKFYVVFQLLQSFGMSGGWLLGPFGPICIFAFSAILVLQLLTSCVKIISTFKKSGLPEDLHLHQHHQKSFLARLGSTFGWWVGRTLSGVLNIIMAAGACIGAAWVLSAAIGLPMTHILIISIGIIVCLGRLIEFEVFYAPGIIHTFAGNPMHGYEQPPTEYKKDASNDVVHKPYVSFEETVDRGESKDAGPQYHP